MLNRLRGNRGAPAQQASDSQWHETLRRSITEPGDLPSWPSSTTQEIFVGHSGEKALAEAFLFFQKVRDSSPRYGPQAHILDFGVGWGRIIRCFYRDIPTSNLHGVDVDPVILAESERTGVKGDLRLIQSTGNLPYADRSMDIVYAFSVFSHLSEDGAKHWLDKLVRVLKPGGTLVFTSTTLKFLNLCRACKKKADGRNMYEEMYAAMFLDPDAEIARYEKGQHVYASVGGNSEILVASEYGWASVPPDWLRGFLGKRAKSVTFSDDGSFDQGVFVVTVA